MCGIAGFVETRPAGTEAGPVLARMLAAVAHRGPDDRGCWFDAAHGVALGQQRLAIVDLSSAGHQPMASGSGRYVITFNGEVYNHAALRGELERANAVPPAGWRGHSDTETLLAAIDAWGLLRALQSAVGMFAFALWDREERTLVLARDRLGEKPLHYGWQGSSFLFGSELKALQAHPAFVARPDWSVARALLEKACIPGPRTIWEGIAKLPPGTMLALRPGDIATRSLPEPQPWWSLEEAARRGRERPFTGSYSDAVDALEGLVRDAVHLQSMADVPVGAFLSGGIDSSTVVAMMQQAAGARVTTFAIGMPERSMDESAHAAAVARHLGTSHVSHVIRPEEALGIIPLLPAIWDEPFADASQIPTWLVCRLAREQVTVALSGDGGDELFLGYPQYALMEKVWRWRGLRRLPWRAGVHAMAALDRSGHWAPARKARIAMAAWQQPDVSHLNAWWMNRFRQDALPLRDAPGLAVPPSPPRGGAAETAALADAGTYLPDDILVKVDRAAMSHGLETRAPLLDHRVVEFAFSLPVGFKLQGAVGKRVLRDVLYRHVPRPLVDRPKTGFSIPLSGWLRRELRPWAEDLLGDIRPASSRLDGAVARGIWADHLAERRDRTEQLWPLLSLLAWCRHNRVET